MATSFFNSWALWEKMTFVLALAILTVFGIGYGKLLWKNRLVKKQESKDEEWRIAVEESQRSRPMIESRKSQDIPFGVRAIQSGIQVDGIWISKDSTPIPSSLKVSHMRNRSSDLTGSRNPSPRDSLAISQLAVQSAPSRGRTTRRESESGILAADQHSTSTEAQDARGYRHSYQPRRSSHLRYDSRGETKYNEETLDQLEGNAGADLEIPSEKAAGTREMENDASSGAAVDNEYSSDSDIDMALSSRKKVQTSQRQSLPQFSGGRPLLEPSKVASSRLPRSSLPPQSSKAEYSPVPLESSEYEQMELLTSPRSSSVEVPPQFRPPYTRIARELIVSGNSQVPLLLHSRSQSRFIPGELHMNKMVRKVNSGFEVLPAGTFGVPIEFNDKGVDQDGRWNQDDDAGEKRYSNKLQKKIRTSMSSRRPSSTFESP